MVVDAPDGEDPLNLLAHDIRHCLHVIGMAVELLRKSPADDRSLREICESIENERDEALKLLNELVQNARQSQDR
jgi:signal transduction histidine kinase